MQLCSQSDLCYRILFETWEKHDLGHRKPSHQDLTRCLVEAIKQMANHHTIYLFIDAIDECPAGLDSVSERGFILGVLEELCRLGCIPLRMCVRSRLESDIQTALRYVVGHEVTLHVQNGQQRDIAMYVRSVVGAECIQWKAKEKNLVIETLSENADGMYVVPSFNTVNH